MTETPLRKYLAARRIAAQTFADQHGLSAANVRHWSRGDKEPSLTSQLAIAAATDGEVSPSDWLSWRLATRPQQTAA